MVCARVLQVLHNPNTHSAVMSFWATYLAALRWNKLLGPAAACGCTPSPKRLTVPLKNCCVQKHLMQITFRQTETQILRFLLRAHAPIVGGADALLKEPPEKTSLCCEYLHVLAFTSARISGHRVYTKSTTEAELTQRALSYILWTTRARTLMILLFTGQLALWVYICTYSFHVDKTYSFAPRAKIMYVNWDDDDDGALNSSCTRRSIYKHKPRSIIILCKIHLCVAGRSAFTF